MVAERSVTPEEALPRPSRSGGDHLRLIQTVTTPSIPELPPHFNPGEEEDYHAKQRPFFFDENMEEIPQTFSDIPLFHPALETAEQRAYNDAVAERYKYLQEYGGPDTTAYLATIDSLGLGVQPSRAIPLVMPGVITLLPYYEIGEDKNRSYHSMEEVQVPVSNDIIFEHTSVTAMAADE